MAKIVINNNSETRVIFIIDKLLMNYEKRNLNDYIVMHYQDGKL